jgi:hypothetical protein
MRARPGEPLGSVVNLSVNQTMTRTIITAGATLMSVVVYLFGGEVLESFAFTMLVGIVSGTWSTVFIALGDCDRAGATWVAAATRCQGDSTVSPFATGILHCRDRHSACTSDRSGSSVT